MRRPPRPLLVLHTDATLLEKLKLASGSRFEFQAVRNWAHLRRQLETAPPAAVVVVDPYSDHELDRELQSVLNEFPSASIVAALELNGNKIGDLRLLGEWGVVDVLLLKDENTEVGLAHRLQSIKGRPLEGLIQHSLPSTTTAQGRAILRMAAETVLRIGGVSDLARSLHLSPRTLLRWTNRAGLPVPRRIMAWMRILLAAELLDDPARTVAGAAFASGYASDTSLRRTLNEFVGRTPTELRQAPGGAFAAITPVFIDELTEARRMQQLNMARMRAERKAARQAMV